MNKDYLKVKFFAGNTVEDAVNELWGYKETGQLACGEFNGVTLYSDTVTMDSAYKKQSLNLINHDKNGEKIIRDKKENTRKKYLSYQRFGWKKVGRFLQKISGNIGIRLFRLDLEIYIKAWS